MLRMDGFDFQQARDPHEALHLWQSRPGARYIAGGTDLLPNVKHRIIHPSLLIGISNALPKGWKIDGEEWVIGAATTLSALSRFSQIAPLARAASLVAGPQIRNMGTLGGNVLLDTRCLFYNQTEFWRKSLGYCLKAEGTWCHVVGGPKTCVATQSSDTVPVLISLGAKARFLGPDGTRDISIADLYKFNGMDHLKVQPGELLLEIRIPCLPDGFRGGYQKLRVRGAIDFPQLSVAVAGTWEGQGPTARVNQLQIVIGAVNPQPKALPGLERLTEGPLDDQAIEQIADLAHAKTRPQGSVHGDTAWRRQLTRVFVRRLLRGLRDQGLESPDRTE